ncbi:MAG TPA: hypothetical protein VLA56_15955 [Pseudomonadales bacterium]|nr:hypothetical protein [Pseudomonadales bacterium]
MMLRMLRDGFRRTRGGPADPTGRVRTSRRGAAWSAALIVAVAALPALAGIQAMPGKDGAGGRLAGVVNGYWPGTASAAAGATTLSLGTRTGAAVTITPGDLLLVMQMQGADIDTRDSGAYGDGVAGDPGAGALATGLRAGTYEYVIAQDSVGAGGGTLTIAGGSGGGLLERYVAAAAGAQGRRSFQVIRVPQYSTAALGSGLTALAWNGSTGGVLALDVQGTLSLGGTVDLAGRGFRGGGSVRKGTVSGTSELEYRTLSTLNRNASKGEGIAGTPRYVHDATVDRVVDLGSEGYPLGSFGAGAPGNAGGGGTDRSTTDHNSGGGGGANGGAGGRGGRAWSPDGLGSELGGFGGAAQTVVATRILMGGGGGAGSRNDTAGPAGSGGAGGAIAMIRTGSIAGAGTVTLDGATGLSSANEGGGGGGAGGSFSLVVYDGTPASGLTVHARGGDGGNAWPTQGPPLSNAHGPGGGGGGGTITSNVAIGSADNSAGDSGTTLDTQEEVGDPGETPIETVVSVDPVTIPGAGGGGLQPLLASSDKGVEDLNGGDANPDDTLRYTITLRERAGVEATGVRVVDTLSTQVLFSNVDLTGAPGASASVDGNRLTLDGITVPAGGDVVVTLDVAIVSSATPGTLVDNAATISSTGIVPFAVAAPTVVVSASSLPASGVKPLYLNMDTGLAPIAIQRALPTITTPDDSYVEVGNRSSATWPLVPGLASTLVIDPNSAGPPARSLQVLLYLTEEGRGGDRDLTVSLERITGTPTVIASVVADKVGMSSNNASPTPVTFDLVPIAGATVTAGEGLRLRVENRERRRGRVLRVHAKAANVGDDLAARSKVLIPTSTVVNVDSVAAYTTPFGGTGVPPGGVFSPDDPVYVRAVVSDPFGSADITGATLAVTDAAGAPYGVTTSMTSVATTAATRTYETLLVPPALPAGPSLPASGPPGFWNLRVTATEGIEGAIEHSALASLEVGLPDFLIMKSSTVFSDPVNGPAPNNPKRIPGALVAYTLQVSNQGRGRATAGSLTVTDRLPAGLALAVDSGNGTPLTFMALTSGLAFTIEADVSWILSSGTVPVDVAPADGFFDNVRGFVITPTGRMNGSLTGTAPEFVLTYRARLE